MPPNNKIQYEQETPRKDSAGPVVGIIIILIIAVFGALYFWGAILNKQNSAVQQLPLITGTTSTTTPQ